MGLTTASKRLRRLGKKNNASITYTKNEPYTICFYHYNLFDGTSYSDLINKKDEGIKLFFKNTELLKKNRCAIR